jgi:hypothetical protein
MDNKTVAHVLCSRKELPRHRFWICEDGRFPVSASCVSISNPDLLSSSEAGVNRGIISWLKNLSEWARYQKAVNSWYPFRKELKSWDSTTWFRNRQLQTPAQKRYLQMLLMAERFVFFGGSDDCSFLKEGAKTYEMTPLLNSSPSFVSSHL